MRLLGPDLKGIRDGMPRNHYRRRISDDLETHVRDLLLRFVKACRV